GRVGQGSRPAGAEGGDLLEDPGSGALPRRRLEGRRRRPRQVSEAGRGRRRRGPTLPGHGPPEAGEPRRGPQSLRAGGSLAGKEQRSSGKRQGARGRTSSLPGGGGGSPGRDEVTPGVSDTRPSVAGSSRDCTGSCNSTTPRTNSTRPRSGGGNCRRYRS